MTSQGHPRTVFPEALEHGNLMLAEVTAREVGHIDLSEALELTALIALRDRPRASSYGVRWLQRYVEAGGAVTIEEVSFVADCPAALGGLNHETALTALRDMAKRATSPRR